MVRTPDPPADRLHLKQFHARPGSLSQRRWYSGPCVPALLQGRGRSLVPGGGRVPLPPPVLVFVRSCPAGGGGRVLCPRRGRFAGRPPPRCAAPIRSLASTGGQCRPGRGVLNPLAFARGRGPTKKGRRRSTAFFRPFFSGPLKCRAAARKGPAGGEVDAVAPSMAPRGWLSGRQSSGESLASAWFGRPSNR